MISRRALFGISAGAAATAVFPQARELRAETYFTELNVAMDFGRPPAIMLCGVKHTDMSREGLIEWVEHLDWHIGNLTRQIKESRI